MIIRETDWISPERIEIVRTLFPTGTLREDLIDKINEAPGKHPVRTWEQVRHLAKKLGVVRPVNLWCTPARWDALVAGAAQCEPWRELADRMDKLPGPPMVDHTSLQKFAARKGVYRPDRPPAPTHKASTDDPPPPRVTRPCLLCRKPFARVYRGQFHCPPCRAWVCEQDGYGSETIRVDFGSLGARSS